MPGTKAAAAKVEIKSETGSTPVKVRPIHTAPTTLPSTQQAAIWTIVHRQIVIRSPVLLVSRSLPVQSLSHDNIELCPPEVFQWYH